VTFALLTAFAWSIASLFFKKAGEYIAPVPLNIINCAVGMVLMLLMAAITGTTWDSSATSSEVWTLVISGAVGICVADVLYLVCLNDLGAGRAAIVETTYSPLAVLGAYLYLNERLGVRDIIGALLVLSSIVVVGFEASSSEGHEPLPRARLARGLVTGFLATAGWATAILAVKPVVATHDVRWAALVRLSGGLGASIIVCFLRPAWLFATLRAFKPQIGWKYALPAGVFGMFISMQLWVAGFKFAKASIAAVLNQTSTLFIVILAAVFLREKLTPMKIAAVVLGFIGSVLVVL
jgi:drug/metabolite transporter (DMT)-like permease